MNTRQQVRRVLAAGIGLALLLTIFIDAAMLSVPLYDMQLYDRVLQSQNMDTLTVLSLACLLGLGLYAFLDYLRGACFIAIGETAGRHLNGVVLGVSVRRAASGETRAGPELIRDLNTLQGFIASGPVAVPLDAVCVPILLAVLFMLHPAFGYLGIAGVSLVLLTGITADALVRPSLLAAREQQTQATWSLSRNLSDPELTEGLGMLPAIGRVWSDRYGHAQTTIDRTNGRALVLSGVSRLVRLALQAAGMTVGALLVISGAATPGSLMGANLLLSKAPAPFDQLVGSWRQWAMAYAAWRRIDLMLAEVTDRAGPPPGADSGPGLRVAHASLRAKDGRLLLDDISLRIAPGSLVVVAGPNGAGKTTLLRLLAGLVPPDDGRVTMDGFPIHGGQGVGYLPQSVSLLDGGIAENIARFQDGVLDETIMAARLAEVHDAIGRMAQGYETPLTRNGAALSGGMRQRIGLARALHGSPRLLVLDEPDASLDGQGDGALLRALMARRDEGAVIIVTSHRPALRSAADLVITIRNGRLDEPRGPAMPPLRPLLATV